MTPLRFAFVLHIHQPVGNFDFVFREHADDVYRPFLDFLEERDLWPVGLHVSGPLIEWLGDHDSALHDRIGRLATDGRVELLSAGWYEPILASLDRVDRATQLGWMREELERRFGVTPKGLWLTERVWVPELAADLAEAGIEYTLVDDHLARRAGASDADILRPMRAEHGGCGVDVFAIDEGLRYLIPFKPADEVAADFRRRHAAGDPIALFADDGEKFGGWPRTREWLYDQGWLEAFGDQMDTLRADGVVRLVTTAAARHELQMPGSAPRVLDLPVGSYAEMDEWAGGPWMRFLDRYSEAGRMHTWMTELTEACRAAGDPPDLRRAVGRAQCNDPYWHGVFGGLYMKHLREGVRRWMARAQRAVAGAPATARADGAAAGPAEPGASAALSWQASRERDGAPAHVVTSPRVYARVTGEAGGTLTELVWLDPHADVTDFLTRRLEAYHAEAVERGRGAAAGTAGRPARPAAADPASPSGEQLENADAPSIHEIEEAATLEALPPVDPAARVLVRDRVLRSDVLEGAYRTGDFKAGRSANPVELPEPERTSLGAVASEPGSALCWRFAPTPDGLEKTLWVSDDRLEIRWRWDPDRFDADAVFAPELSVGCPVELTLEPDPDATWRYPIVTTSKCPDGFEEITQGESVTPRWPIRIGRARLVLRPK